MFSKQRYSETLKTGYPKVLKLSLIGILLFSTFGCGLKLGEKAPKNQNIKVGEDARFSCMGQIGATLGRYVRAQISEPEVNEFVDCLSYSLTSFETYTSGEEKTGYSPEELRKFLEDHFLKEKRISDQLLIALMDLKVTVLGGKTDEVSRVELKGLVEIIEKIRPITIRMRPLMAVLNPSVGDAKWTELQKVYPLTKVKDELSWAADALADILDGSAGQYSMSSMQNLIYEFRKFVNWEVYFSNTRPSDRWVDLVKVLKGLMVRPPEESVEPEDWRPLLEVSSHWYVQYLRFHYQIENLHLLKGEGLKEINALFEDSFFLVDLAVQRHPNRVIEIEEIDRLFEALERLKLLPFNLRASSLKEFVRPLLARVFGDPQLDPDLRELRGLTRYNLSLGRAEFSRWSDIQMFLDEQYYPRNTGGRDGIFNLMNPMFSPSQRSFSEDILRINEKMRPLFRQNESNVFLVEEGKMEAYNVTQGFHNLSFMNLIRAAVGLGMRGFASSFNTGWSMDSGFTNIETQKLYEAIQSVGIDLKIMDPRSRDAGKRSFIEGNLFTYQGNGINERSALDGRKHLLVFEESMELVAFLFSGGSLADKIYNDLAVGDRKAGVMPLCNRGGVGIHGNPRVQRSCVKKHFMDLLRVHAHNMPELVTYLDSLDPERRTELSQALLNASFGKNSLNDFVEKSEISVMVMIVHYSESVMTRYNKNLNATLDTDEIWRGYPTFRGFIEKMLKDRCKDSSEGNIKNVFRYIISRGTIPDDGDWTVMLGVVIDSIFWNPSLDRGRVLEVFSSIMSVVMRAGDNPTTAAVCE